MPEDKHCLTEEKFNEIKEELETLKHDKRKEIAENLEYAKSLGDLSENAEYQDAREAQAKLEDRILHLEEILRNAEIVSEHDTNKVALGSVIEIRRKGARATEKYTIVGTEEANLAEKKISVKSPLGQAAFGKGCGDKFSFETPSGEIEYSIVSIH